MTAHYEPGSERKIYQIEVCEICGGHLNNRYNRSGHDGSAANGRCGNDESHWSAGGVLLDVTPIPLDQQREPRQLRYLVANGVVPAPVHREEGKG